MRRMGERHSDRLHFADDGRGDPIVLLHAFPLDGAMWDAERAALSRSHRVIVPDLRGFGKSADLAVQSTLDHHVADLARMLDDLKLERVTLGGLSMGGYIALAFARKFPARLSRLILADTRSVPDDPEGKKARDANIALVASEGVPPLVERLLPKLLSTNSGADVKDQVRAWAGRQTQAGVIAALAAMRDRPDARPSLPSILVPSLVLVGELDAISPVAEARAIAAALPKAELALIEGAGHLANLEQPARFLAAIQRFVGA
jgi:pimeloyl-ACP methyl ester carboxylesterase